MTQSLLQSTLATLLFLTPTTPQLPQARYEIPLQEPIRKVKYVVKKGDALVSIAEDQYGYEEYWTNILKDNDWIKDPDVLEEGWEIKLRTTPPLLIAEYDLPAGRQGREKVLGDSEEITDSVILTVQPVISPAIQSVGATGPLSDAQIGFLGHCESGMTATRNSGNGYYGAFQFSVGTWNSMGTGYARADLAPLEVQKDAVQRLLSRSSIWTQFPGCAHKMRSNGLI